ncbi:U1 zinc finger domain-containing protein [Paracoccidioides lutzii Pb01]|uniref:U1 zinc finger domain-containing protein n=1 Tax=Paracoccidioides lutzii (strain ATCC MYA-826 / Pb01) TaxID=502779 RepID=C1GW59_PARBA|nr:U1 zinc finger domain-containing protein [Paracoccidioides lutzii Pb01]EEH40778.2 U1 zinc finger domain-containing protein [Paracoccidioides lutzii Pb01]
MAEYWKSTPKYWCKHCKIYVRDTSFERTQHEATGKHQGNLTRFLRVNSTATGTGTGNSTASRFVMAAQRKEQLAQLVELGVAIPEEFRKDMALAGDWEVVEEVSVEKKGAEVDEMAALNVGVRKRKFEGQEEEEAAGETVVRQWWGSTTRRFPGTDEKDDLDALLEKTAELKRRKREAEIKVEAKDEEGLGEGVVKRECENADHGSYSLVKKEEIEDGSTEVKVEEEKDGKDVSKSIPEAAKDASEEVVPAVVFKKRKPKHAR